MSKPTMKRRAAIDRLQTPSRRNLIAAGIAPSTATRWLSEERARAAVAAIVKEHAAEISAAVAAVVVKKLRQPHASS